MSSSDKAMVYILALFILAGIVQVVCTAYVAASRQQTVECPRCGHVFAAHDGAERAEGESND